MSTEQEHHIWCNFFMRPREECPSCKRLDELYPMDGITPDELLVKHFPKVAVMNNIKGDSA